MTINTANMFEILNGNKQFLVPVYQRYYSWEKEQWERLWDDIENIINNKKNVHFIGSIVNVVEKSAATGLQKYIIIDGQQRMTTLILLLIALRDYETDYLNNSSEINPDKINDTILKNVYENGEELYKLLLTKKDKTTLINLIDRKNIGNDESLKITNSYNYFFKKIKESKCLSIDIYGAIGKLQIVDITLDPVIDNAQVIFESLNSTGKALSESDLIRNYILMNLNNREQRDIYENIWYPMENFFIFEKKNIEMDRFFRDYLTMKLIRIPKIDKIYDEFKAYDKNNNEFESIKELCLDIYRFAKYYTDIKFNRSNNAAINTSYKDINKLKMEVIYPFILKIHDDCYEKKIITLDELKEMMDLCISYILRRAICEIPTNSLNKTFATLKKEINKNDYVTSIKAAFKLKEGYKSFPTNEEFIKAFITKDIYNMNTRNFILNHLENFDNKAPIVSENFTIEHIMPQNNKLSKVWQNSLGENWKEIQKEYLHTIGNITLTAYNSEMSDKSFIEKLEMPGGFKESALRLNAYVIKQTNWNEINIQERAKLLAKKAIEIWKFPKINDDKLKPYIKNKKSISNYTLDYYDFNETTTKLFKMLNSRILNLSPDVKQECKKLYIAYKLDSNFVDVVVQKKRLRLSLNMKFQDIDDPYNICKDITKVGRWGNGDVELFLNSLEEIDQTMEMIEQAYNYQFG